MGRRIGSAMRRRRPYDPDPFEVLGLDRRSATRADIVAARRRLARELHPDRNGGDSDRMVRVNRAADAALESLSIIDQAPPRADSNARRAGAEPPRHVRRDHPSFTIDVLPAEAFEALLIVTGWIGQLADEDPPYRLETVLDGGLWCALELVPDAAATTVSVAVDVAEGDSVDVESIRDQWVWALNLLDWEVLDPAQPRPW
ncbi:MAG: J domain-containing protein [Ilumatobacteraceae bacterium]